MPRDVSQAIGVFASRMAEAPQEETREETIQNAVVDAANGLEIPVLEQRKQEIEAKISDAFEPITTVIKEKELGKKAMAAGGAGTAVVGAGLLLNPATAPVGLGILLVEGAAVLGAKRAAEISAPKIKDAMGYGAATLSLAADGFKYRYRQLTGKDQEERVQEPVQPEPQAETE